MTKRVFLFLSFLVPAFLHAQSAFSDCDHVYTKVENLPSLKISNEAFEDTLATTLKSKKFSFKDNEVTYRFVVTDKSKIDELQIESGKGEKTFLLSEAILELSDLWNPATQNGYIVCCYVRLNIKFANKKIQIEITQ